MSRESGFERDGGGRESVDRFGEAARGSANVLFLHSPPTDDTTRNKTNIPSSPFILATSDPQRELLDPVLCGTVNLLSSAAKENERRRSSADGGGGGDGSRKEGEGRRPLRVVLTSSVAAVHGEYEAPPKNGSLYSEEDWNVSRRG